MVQVTQMCFNGKSLNLRFSLIWLLIKKSFRLGVTAEIKALEKSINYYHFLSKALLKKSLN